MIKTILLDLPTTVRGFVRLKDGVYTIVLNARLTRDANRRTYVHELRHIMDGDLFSDRPIDDIERRQHGKDRKA